MGLQRVRHNLVTEQQTNLFKRLPLPQLFILVPLPQNFTSVILFLNSILFHQSKSVSIHQYLIILITGASE